MLPFAHHHGLQGTLEKKDWGTGGHYQDGGHPWVQDPPKKRHLVPPRGTCEGLVVGLGPRGLAAGGWGLRDGGGRLGSEMMVPVRETKGGEGHRGVPKGVPRGVPSPGGLTKGLSTLSPGIGVPLEFHVTLRLHGVHDHLEGTVELEGDLGDTGGALSQGRDTCDNVLGAPVTTRGAQGDAWQWPTDTHHVVATLRGRMAAPWECLSHHRDPEGTHGRTLVTSEGP